MSSALFSLKISHHNLFDCTPFGFSFLINCTLCQMICWQRLRLKQTGNITNGEIDVNEQRYICYMLLDCLITCDLSFLSSMLGWGVVLDILIVCKL